MKVSKVGLALIKKYEGFSSKPYMCPANKATIGYGNTFYADGSPVTLNDKPISEEQASELLEKVIVDFSLKVSQLVKVPLAQNQFDALVSFTYNVGPENFRKSTLLKLLNAYKYSEAANEITKWVYSSGKILPGLVRRRIEEKALFTQRA